MGYLNGDFQVGWELFVGVLGLGATRVCCWDECGNPRCFDYRKWCVGVGASAGFTTGTITGMHGGKCREETYLGWYFESSVGLGPFGVGAGANATGVGEIDAVIGPGIKTGFCKYWLTKKGL